MTSLSASQHLQKVLEHVMIAARNQKTFHQGCQAALEEINSKKVYFSLFETQLVDKDEYKDTTSRKVVHFRDSDVTVGFLADTKASFILCAGSPREPIRLPVTLEAGEFQLAWQNETLIPTIRFAFHDVWVESLQGSVRRISALLGCDERRELVQLRSLPLGKDAITAWGMVGRL